jgi:hypothetical protein
LRVSEELVDVRADHEIDVNDVADFGEGATTAEQLLALVIEALAPVLEDVQQDGPAVVLAQRANQAVVGFTYFVDARSFCIENRVLELLGEEICVELRRGFSLEEVLRDIAGKLLAAQYNAAEVRRLLCLLDLLLELSRELLLEGGCSYGLT